MDRKHWILAGLLAVVLSAWWITCMSDAPKGAEDGTPAPYVQ